MSRPSCFGGFSPRPSVTQKLSFISIILSKLSWTPLWSQWVKVIPCSISKLSTAAWHKTALTYYTLRQFPGPCQTSLARLLNPIREIRFCWNKDKHVEEEHYQVFYVGVTARIDRPEDISDARPFRHEHAQYDRRVNRHGDRVTDLVDILHRDWAMSKAGWEEVDAKSFQFLSEVPS